MTNNEIVKIAASKFITGNPVVLEAVASVAVLMKEQKVKDYLEEKKLEYENERGTLRFGGDVIEEIIKELFKED